MYCSLPGPCSEARINLISAMHGAWRARLRVSPRSITMTMTIQQYSGICCAMAESMGTAMSADAEADLLV